jgi:hypothetical protein
MLDCLTRHCNIEYLGTTECILFDWMLCDFINTLPYIRDAWEFTSHIFRHKGLTSGTEFTKKKTKKLYP